MLTNSFVVIFFLSVRFKQYIQVHFVLYSIFKKKKMFQI